MLERNSPMSTTVTNALTTHELRELAQSILDDRDAWLPLVQADPRRRHYEIVRDDELVTAWVISWMDGHDTGYHDHDLSAAAVAVGKGAVVDERLRVGGAPETRVLEAGEVLSVGVSEIHRVKHLAGEPAVTIHVYSPPLERSGAYVFAETGALLRRPRTADEELRPQPVTGAFVRARAGDR
jgi:predicted metal-dependent enzyme (double-stranded beta helix superfamily)